MSTVRGLSLLELLQVQFTDSVVTAFSNKLASKKSQIVVYTHHAQEEMSNDRITTSLLESCMAKTPELIEFHWEYPLPGAKGVFLCEPEDFQPFHVVCLFEDGRVFVKTAYIVTSDKYKPDNRTRVPRKKPNL